MIEEEIKIRINPEGTDEVTDALDALDALESKAHQVNRSTEAFIKLAADAAKARSPMSDAAKFTKTLPAAPVRPLNMNKLMPDYYRPPAGGKRMAGISPAALPIVASFISPAIIGAVLNRYDPFLKGAAEKYFLDPKKHDPRLSEYLLGTTPGFLYGTTRAGINKLRYPEGPPPEPPPRIAEDTAAWRKLRAWTPPDPWTGYPDSYRQTKEFKKLTETQAPDPWRKHLFWAQKRYARWRRPPYAADFAEGTEEHPLVWRAPQNPKDTPLPQRSRAFTPAPPSPEIRFITAAIKARAAAPSVLGSRNEFGADAIRKQAELRYAFSSSRRPPGTDWDRLWKTGTTGPLGQKHVAYPPPTIPPTPSYEFTKGNHNILRAFNLARDAIRPPDIKAPLDTSASLGAPAFRDQTAQTRTQGVGQRQGNTYHITVHKIADTIQGQTVDQKSIMKLLGTIVETELPTR